MNGRGLSDLELERVVDSFPEGLLLIDKHGSVVYSNREAWRLLGVRVVRCVGRIPKLHEHAPTGLLVWRSIGPLLHDTIGERRLRIQREAACPLRIEVRRVFDARYAISVREEVPRDAQPVALGFAKALEGSRPVEPEPPRWSDPLTLAHMENVLDSLPIGILVVDQEGALGWLNRAAVTLLEGTATPKELTRAARHVAAGTVASPAWLRLQAAGVALRVFMWRAGIELAGIRIHREQTRGGAILPERGATT